MTQTKAEALTPDEALARLHEGNLRFIRGETAHPFIGKELLKRLAKDGQIGSAFATVVTCSDSRVPAEIVFDTSAGDIFVVRTAGNACLSLESLASVEYGVMQVHTPLVIVMGHTHCSAIMSAAEYMESKERNSNEFIDKYIGHLQEELERAHTTEKPEDLIIRNIYDAIGRIRKNCLAINPLEAAGTVRILPALYHLENGRIDWLPPSRNEDRNA